MGLLTWAAIIACLAFATRLLILSRENRNGTLLWMGIVLAAGAISAVCVSHWAPIMIGLVITVIVGYVGSADRLE